MLQCEYEFIRARMYTTQCETRKVLHNCMYVCVVCVYVRDQNIPYNPKFSWGKILDFRNQPGFHEKIFRGNLYAGSVSTCIVSSNFSRKLIF